MDKKTIIALAKEGIMDLIRGVVDTKLLATAFHISWILQLNSALYWQKIVQKYIFSDFEFIPFLLITIVCDTLAKGIYIKKYARDTFSWKLLFSGLVDKLAKYSLILIVAHVLKSFTVNGVANGLFTWILLPIYAILMANEAASAAKSLDFKWPEKIQELIDSVTKTKKNDLEQNSGDIPK